jgi:hypothetical protein
MDLFEEKIRNYDSGINNFVDALSGLLEYPETRVTYSISGAHKKINNNNNNNNTRQTENIGYPTTLPSATIRYF